MPPHPYFSASASTTIMSPPSRSASYPHSAQHSSSSSYSNPQQYHHHHHNPQTNESWRRQSFQHTNSNSQYRNGHQHHHSYHNHSYRNPHHPYHYRSPPLQNQRRHQPTAPQRSQSITGVPPTTPENGGGGGGEGSSSIFSGGTTPGGAPESSNQQQLQCPPPLTKFQRFALFCAALIIAGGLVGVLVAGGTDFWLVLEETVSPAAEGELQSGALIRDRDSTVPVKNDRWRQPFHQQKTMRMMTMLASPSSIETTTSGQGNVDERQRLANPAAQNTFLRRREYHVHAGIFEGVREHREQDREPSTANETTLNSPLKNFSGTPKTELTKFSVLDLLEKHYNQKESTTKSPSIVLDFKFFTVEISDRMKWLTMLSLIALGALWNGIGVIVALRNVFARERPKRALVGPAGLLFWTTISMLCYGIALALFLWQFYGVNHFDWLFPYDEGAGRRQSGGSSSREEKIFFGFSFWLMAGATGVQLVPLLFLLISLIVERCRRNGVAIAGEEKAVVSMSSIDDTVYVQYCG